MPASVHGTKWGKVMQKPLQLDKIAQRVDELEDMINGLCAYVAFLAEQQGAPPPPADVVGEKLATYLSDARRLAANGAGPGALAKVAMARVNELRSEIKKT